MEQATLSASQSGIVYKRARDVETQPQPDSSRLVAGLDAILDAATAVYLEALGDSEKPTTKLYPQKKKPRQRTSPGTNSPRAQRSNRHKSNSVRD